MKSAFSSTQGASGALLDAEAEERNALVERVVASPSFAKSPRLCEFLRYVCRLASEGRLDEINEQSIGTFVFGRRQDYDPTVDSIVRSHASRLRQRLEQYFAQEGAAEPLVLTMPRGSYIPIFERRAVVLQHVPSFTPAQFLVDSEGGASGSSADAYLSSDPEQAGAKRMSMITAELEAERRNAKRLKVLLTATASIGFAAILTLLALWLTARNSGSGAAFLHHPLWSQLFNTGERTLIVNGDSGAVMLQNITKRRISLESYLSGDYVKNVDSPPVPPDLILNLGTRRYTSMVDLKIQEKIFRLLESRGKLADFRYSRDIRPDQIKQGNVILLGTYESTPWVQLFEPTMNFYFVNDLASGSFSLINRSPHPGESSHYDSLANDPQKTVYGLVAFRPTLSGSGNVLILEGQSMAGTQTASDFVFDDGYLLPFLHQIQNSDGTIPHFELLLRSKNLNGESARIEIVAYRVEKN